MKEILRMCLSDNGKEFLLYSDDGETLERAIGVFDFPAIGEAAREAALYAQRDDFAERNGREYRACMGYEDCTPYLCDDHYPNGSGNGERLY